MYIYIMYTHKYMYTNIYIYTHTHTNKYTHTYTYIIYSSYSGNYMSGFYSFKKATEAQKLYIFK